MVALAAKNHRKDIDGLRAVAVLSVLGFHCGVPGFSGGFVGVDVFFVISGYLICSIIVRDIEKGRFSIAGFYERRCKRILPALFVVCGFCLVAALVLLSPYEASLVGQGILATSLSWSNLLFYFQGNYFRTGTLNPLLMTWSLAVEEQFYIAFPLLMLLLYKRSKRHLFGALASLCALSLLLSVYMEFHHPELNFYSPFTRAWEIGAGTLLAFWEAHRGRRGEIQSVEEERPEGERPDGLAWGEHVMGAAGLLMILGCVFLYSARVRFPGYEAVPPVLGTILLIAARDGAASRLLGLRPLVGVGLISYSLYLWHWPLLSFATIMTVHTPAVTRAVLMAIAFAAATLSYFFVEEPFRSRVYASRQKVLIGYGTLIVCLAAVSAGFYFSGGVPWRAPRLAHIEKTIAADREHTCSSVAGHETPQEGCVPPVSSVPAIALLGDSHAEALQAAVQSYAEAHGFKVVTLTLTACPPLKGMTTDRADNPDFPKVCQEYNDRIFSSVAARPDVKYVALAGDWALVDQKRFFPVGLKGSYRNVSQEQSEANLVEGLKAEVAGFEAAGKRVVLFDDVPSLTFAPADRARYDELPVRRALTKLMLGRGPEYPAGSDASRSAMVSGEAEKARAGILQLAQSDHELTVVDSKSVLCSEAECRFADGDDFYYTDNNHLSPLGARLIVAQLHLEGK